MGKPWLKYCLTCVYESWLEILDLSDSDLEARKHTFKLTNFIIQQTISPPFFHFPVGKLSIF